CTTVERREGGVGTCRLGAAAVDGLRTTRVSGRRRVRSRNRRALWSARRRLRNRADLTAVDARTGTTDDAPRDRTGIFHGGVVLRRARRRTVPGDRRRE